MKYKIIFKPSAYRQLQKVGRTNYLKLKPAIFSLEFNPRQNAVVKLSSTDLYRIRVGDFRIIFQIREEEKVVVITKIARRSKDTYKDI